MKLPPSGSEIATFQSNLQQINKNFGLSLYMEEWTAKVRTKAGPAPLSEFLSYLLAPTEGNFKVSCNIDLFKGPNENEVPSTYPPFPISTAYSLYQPLFDSLQLSEAEATKIEQETYFQRNCDQWWTQQKSRITFSINQSFFKEGDT